MSSSRRAQRAARTRLVVTVSIIGAAWAVGCQALAGSSAVSSPTPGSPLAATQPHLQPPEPPRLDRSSGLDADDGVVSGRATVFGDEPAVAKLDPALLSAVRRAATDAARDGVALYVDSGWRSRQYQEALLRQAVEKHGSRKKAARWVATPDASAHVSGEAVDIGGGDARGWLSRHGARYGLCQTYRNEPWHFELRAAAVHDGCPAMYADPTQDPRLRARA